MNIKQQELKKWQNKMLVQLISGLKNRCSFGYKVFTKSEVECLQSYYQTIFKKDFKLNAQNMQFFGFIKSVYVYLMIGLTNPGDSILSTEFLAGQLQTQIRKFGRKLTKVEGIQTKKQKIISKIRSQIEGKKILIIKNPSINGNIWTKDQIQQIINLCKANSTYLICDETLGLFCQKMEYESTINFNYQNLMTIKQIGRLFQNDKISKHIVFYGSKLLKDKIGKSAAKGLKILPTDLALQLIKVETSQTGIKCREIMVNNLRKNFQCLKAFLDKISCYTEQEYQPCSQYLVLNKQKLKSRQLTNNIVTYLDAQQVKNLQRPNQQFIVVNLNTNNQLFRKNLQYLSNLTQIGAKL